MVGIFFGTRLLAFDLGRTQDIQISFPFSGAEKGQYPNETSFQLSDIVSSQVLSVVYEKQKLSESGISLKALTNNISIQPYAIDREFIDKKYKARLSAKDLSQAEIAELESSYKEELTTASHRSATLSYSYSKHDRIPPQLIGKLLFDIPATWAKIAVNQNGVLTPPVVDKNVLTSREQLKTADFLIGVSLMQNDIATILSVSELITSNERLSLIRDPNSGLSLVGLINRLDKFNRYQLDPLLGVITSKNLYKDIAASEQFLLSKRQTLSDMSQLLDRKILVYSNIFQETLKASRSYGDELRLPKGTGTETQLGGDFLGQLMKLGGELSDSTFRESILEKKIELELQSEDTSTELIKLQRQLEGLQARRESISGSTPVFEPYDKAIEEFISLMDNYDRIISLVQKHVLSSTGTLYESLNSTARVTNFNQIQLRRIIIFALVALILGVWSEPLSRC